MPRLGRVTSGQWWPGWPIMQAAVLAALLAFQAGERAAAQELPRWPVAEICSREAGYCSELEARARQIVSGGWDVLPSAYRKACLDEMKTPADRSWRLLSQCLEGQVLAGLDRREIKTANTPEPPTAPATSAPPPPAPSDVPGMAPPVFGVPTAPPRIQ